LVTTGWITGSAVTAGCAFIHLLLVPHSYTPPHRFRCPVQFCGSFTRYPTLHTVGSSTNVWLPLHRLQLPFTTVQFMVPTTFYCLPHYSSLDTHGAVRFVGCFTVTVTFYLWRCGCHTGYTHAHAHTRLPLCGSLHGSRLVLVTRAFTHTRRTFRTHGYGYRLGSFTLRGWLPFTPRLPRSTRWITFTVTFTVYVAGCGLVGLVLVPGCAVFVLLHAVALLLDPTTLTYRSWILLVLVVVGYGSIWILVFAVWFVVTRLDVYVVVGSTRCVRIYAAVTRCAGCPTDCYAFSHIYLIRGCLFPLRLPVLRSVRGSPLRWLYLRYFCRYVWLRFLPHTGFVAVVAVAVTRLRLQFAALPFTFPVTVMQLHRTALVTVTVTGCSRPVTILRRICICGSATFPTPVTYIRLVIAAPYITRTLRLVAFTFPGCCVRSRCWFCAVLRLRLRFLPRICRSSCFIGLCDRVVLLAFNTPRSVTVGWFAVLLRWTLLRDLFTHGCYIALDYVAG